MCVEAGVFAGLASDHSPCTYDEKFNEILGQKIENVFDVWGGISGIQSCVQAIYSEGVVKRGVDHASLLTHGLSCLLKHSTFMERRVILSWL